MKEQIGSWNSETTQAQCLNTIETFSLPPISVITLTSLLLLKSQFLPPHMRNMNTQFVFSTHPLWKKDCQLLSIPHTQKLQVRALIGPAGLGAQLIPISSGCGV